MKRLIGLLSSIVFGNYAIAAMTAWDEAESRKFSGEGVSFLCYAKNQSVPLFQLHITTDMKEDGSPEKANTLNVGLFTFDPKKGYGSSGKVERYHDVIPTFDKVAKPSQGRYMKIKLGDYDGGLTTDLPYRPITPQWQGKVLEFKRFAPMPEYFVNPNAPRHGMLYFTVTVDSKAAYSCGLEPV